QGYGKRFAKRRGNGAGRARAVDSCRREEFILRMTTRAGRSRRATQQLTKPAKGGRRPMRKPVTKIAGFTIPPVDRFRLPTDDTDDDERYSHLKAIYRRRLYMSLAALRV